MNKDQEDDEASMDAGIPSFEEAVQERRNSHHPAKERRRPRPGRSPRTMPQGESLLRGRLPGLQATPSGREEPDPGIGDSVAGLFASLFTK